MKKILIGFIAIGLLMLVGCGTNKTEGSGVTDVDGNIYNSVIIGKQEWVVQNLNVAHFRNGDIIPEAKRIDEWEKAGKEKRPAWCYFLNEKSNGDKYGKLYNFYAVCSPRGLAPKGWRISTDADWTVLTDYLAADGQSGKEGTALRATSGWEDGMNPHTNKATIGNGTDDYGWNGLPGGMRSNPYVGFFDIGIAGKWWCDYDEFGVRTVSPEEAGPWMRILSSNDDVFRCEGITSEGYSVRCLRD